MQPKYAWRPIAWTLLFCALALLPSGCSFFEGLRGDKFTDDDANWGESLRPPEKKGQMAGLSEKARQIERNVGYR